MEASISGDTSKLKGIYKIPKKAGRPKAVSKAKTILKSSLKK